MWRSDASIWFLWSSHKMLFALLLLLSANKKFKWNKNKNPPSNAAVAHCFHSSASFHAIIIFRVMILVKAKYAIECRYSNNNRERDPLNKRPTTMEKNEFVKIKFYNVQFTSRQTICMKRKWLSFVCLAIKNKEYQNGDVNMVEYLLRHDKI